MFICKSADMWRDCWTYGNYTQYICKRAAETQCARISSLNVVIPMITGIIAGGIAMVMIAGDPANVIWPRAIFGSALFGVVTTAWVSAQIMGYRIMHAVGPMNKDGKRVIYNDMR